MGAASTEADSILSSVWFQLVIALLVLSITLFPQLYQLLLKAPEPAKPKDDMPPAKPSTTKRSKSKKNNTKPPPAEPSLEERMEKQLAELAAQQTKLKQVQEETEMLKAEAVAEAKQTKADAKNEAEALTRRVFEEMTLKREELSAKAQADDAAALLKAAEAQAQSMKQTAELEAARVRKGAEVEAAALRKLAVEEAEMLRNMETKKRAMEEEVRVSAARAREKMTDEVETLRKRAEVEVQELRQKATKEAAAMFMRADQNVQQQHSVDKPPRLPNSAPAAPPPLNVQQYAKQEEHIPKSVTPPRSPVVGSDRKAPESNPMPLNVMAPAQSPLHQPITHNWTAGWTPPAQEALPPAYNGKVPPVEARAEKGGMGGMVPDMTQLVPYKLKLCIKFMQTGHCKRAAGCTYAHGDHEIGMQRPQELLGVTLAEMNARKKGKNMVAPATARAAAEEIERQNRAMAQERFQQERLPEKLPEAVQPAPAPPAAQPAAPKSQWDKPPRINVPRANPVKSKPPSDVLRGSGGNKEPSPFLPLSPSLDEPWNRDSDGRAAMSWADSAITPPTAPQTP